MNEQDYRVAVDIGNSKVSALIARRGAGYSIEAIGAADALCDDSKGPGARDQYNITEALRTAVSEAGRQAGVRVSRAYVSISGPHLECVTKWDEVPRSNVVRVITDADLSTALRVAAKVDLSDNKQLLHVIPRSYVLDGMHSVRNALGMRCSDLTIQTHSISGSAEVVRLLGHIARNAGVTPDGMIVEQVADGEALLTADEREDGVVLVNIGSGNTGISVFYQGAIIYTTAIPVGGFHFTNDLSIAFSIPFEEAEILKKSEGSYVSDLPKNREMEKSIVLKPHNMSEAVETTRRDIAQLLRERSQEIFRMILIKLDEMHLEGIPMDRMVITGGVANGNGFQNDARYTLQRQVRVGIPEKLYGMDDKFATPAHSTVIGMMLWSMRNLPPAQHVSPLGTMRSGGEAGERNQKKATTSSGVLSSIFSWVSGKKNMNA